MTVPFFVDAFGEFPPGHVRVHWSDTPRPSTPELDSVIAEVWERQLVECRARGAILFNGRLVRWVGHRVEDGVLHVDTGPTDYRDFLGTNVHNAHRVAELGRERFSNPIGTTATVISRDGWLLYGRRSHRVVVHAGYLHTFGGSLEEADLRPGNVVDPFAAVGRELFEELGLGPGHIDEMVCVGLIHDHELVQPEMLFEAGVNLTRDDLLLRLDHSDVHQEHTAIESVRDEPDALAPFIRRSAPIAPVALAAICLHGWRRWGRGWYDAVVAALWGEPPTGSAPAGSGR